jgi:hypothetical protein
MAATKRGSGWQVPIVRAVVKTIFPKTEEPSDADAKCSGS